MKTYDFKQHEKEWTDHIDQLSSDESKFAKRVYSTADYYDSEWLMAKHGKLILDFKGNIVDANPAFLERLNYQHDELIGKNIHEFCVKDDMLYGSDIINISTLLQSQQQQAIAQCDIEEKSRKLIRCRWVANRIPSNLDFHFSHSMVDVYFTGETNYAKLLENVDKFKETTDREANKLYQLLDSVWSKIIIMIIVLLTAIGGSLPDIIKTLIDHF